MTTPMIIFICFIWFIIGVIASWLGYRKIIEIYSTTFLKADDILIGGLLAIAGPINLIVVINKFYLFSRELEK